MPFSPSIDHFLRDAEQAHTQLAKAAIAFLLLNCEKSHSRDLGAIDSSDLADITLDGIWQQVFCENLFTDCDRNNLAIANALERCRVISFNYDRTFEFIFHQSLRGRFSISDETIIKLLSKNLKIAYPYGCLGSLNSDDNKHFCKYGAPLRHDTDSKRRAMVATNGIRTFNEGAGPDKTFAEFVSWAERIVFLGFGFHGQNIRLLAPEQAAKPQIILGTTKGLRGAAIHDLKQSLKKAFRTEAVELHDLDCFHLLEEFRHLLVE